MKTKINHTPNGVIVVIDILEHREQIKKLVNQHLVIITKSFLSLDFELQVSLSPYFQKLENDITKSLINYVDTLSNKNKNALYNNKTKN